MLKYLLLALLVIWLFYSPALRGLRRGKVPGQVKTPPPSPTPSAAPLEAETMVQCAHCGVHLPMSEALKDAQGRTYCSTAHRQAAAARP